jgi:lysophospholipase L1-like esterase
MSTIKAATGRILLILASVSATLCLLELTIRHFYPQPIGDYNFTLIQADGGGEMVLGHRVPTVARRPHGYGPYLPNLATKFGGVPITINSRGWRDTEHVFAKPEDLTRIMVVGDSVAFGYGVELHDMFSKVLEREVNGQGAARYEVMTFGGAGGNTYAQKKIIADNVPLYNPDWVVIAFNLNDILPDRTKKQSAFSGGSGNSVVRAMNRARRNLDATFRGRSHLYFLFRERSKVLLRRFGVASPAMIPLPAFELEDDRSASAWHDTSAALVEIAGELQKQGIPLLLVILPVDIQMSSEVAAMYRQQFGFRFADSLIDGLPQRMIAEFARRHGIACVDLLPAFRRRSGENVFFRVHGGIVDWNHPNRTGHRIIGEELASALKTFAVAGESAVAQAVRGRRLESPPIGMKARVRSVYGNAGARNPRPVRTAA